MTWTKTYSKVTDFSDTFKPSQFKDEVNADVGITPTIDHINTLGDIIDVIFTAEVLGGELTVLSGLVAVHSPSTNIPGVIFDAIVDADGGGDYLLPSAAFAAGHLSVFMRNGIYVETSDIIIPNYGSLVGESGPNTVIYYPGIAKSVIVDGSGGVQETAGTISITNGSTAVVGVGTTFTNLAASGNYILLGTNYYKIASITDATNLVLSDVYNGASIVSMSYIAQNMFTGIYLHNFIITGSTTYGLYIRGCRHYVVDGVAIRSNSPNMMIENSGDSSLKHVLVENGVGIGLKLNNCASISLGIVDVYNNTSHGIEIVGTSCAINLLSCEFSNNGGTGCYVMGSCKNINMTNCIIKYNNQHGILCDSTTESVTISNIDIEYNTLIGLSLSGYKHIITGNEINFNEGIGIHLLANECTANGNTIDGNTTGIKIDGVDNIINSNHCVYNSLDGMLVNGNTCVITSNISKFNTQSGIKIETGIVDTICSLNNTKNNTGTNIVDNGTASVISNNIE